MWTSGSGRGFFGIEVVGVEWIDLRAEGRYGVTGILGNGGVSAAFDETELGGFGGGFKAHRRLAGRLHFGDVDSIPLGRRRLRRPPRRRQPARRLRAGQSAVARAARARRAISATSATTLATREEEAFGIAAGLYLGGARPTVMLQSSGLGNSLNALTSLLLPYQIPVLIVISMRGDAGEWNAAQVPMGRAVRADLRRDRRLPHATAEIARMPQRDGARGRADGVRHPAAGACLLPRRMTVPAVSPRMNRLEATRRLVDRARRRRPSSRASAIRRTICSPPAIGRRISTRGAAWAWPRRSVSGWRWRGRTCACSCSTATARC